MDFKHYPLDKSLSSGEIYWKSSYTMDSEMRSAMAHFVFVLLFSMTINSRISTTKCRSAKKYLSNLAFVIENNTAEPEYTIASHLTQNATLLKWIGAVVFQIQDNIILNLQNNLS